MGTNSATNWCSQIAIPRTILLLILVTPMTVCGCKEAPPEDADQQMPGVHDSQPTPLRPATSSESASDKQTSEEHSADGHGDSPQDTGVHPVFAAQTPFDHAYLNGASGEELMVESTGGGVGCLDFDRDGYPDAWLNQGGSPKAADLPTNPSDQLFRNMHGRIFDNVTSEAGIRESRFSQGVAAGDFDNDGFVDVYITNVGANTLFRNLGDGTFEEIPGAFGMNDVRWSSSAAWADLNSDGNLDLYVCNYLKYDPDDPVICRHENGEPGLCDPHQVEPWDDEFFLNLGEPAFQPAAKELGLFGEGGKALGVAVTDFNDDRLPDIYVCNDTTANFLFLQNTDGTFTESAQQKGCALSGYGEAQASMGIAVGDFNRDMRPDIYLTHFTRESNTLYQNLGPAGFADVTSGTGLHAPTLHVLGFGVVMEDFDLNGHDDIFVANGHIDDWSPHNEDYRQRPLLFSWTGQRWNDNSSNAGPIFESEFVGRGVACADIDLDGDQDLICVRHNQPPLLLSTETQHGHAIRIRLVGTTSNRFGIGTQIKLTDGSGQTLVKQLPGGTSYCATHEPVLTFPVRLAPIQVEVQWPGGKTTSGEINQTNGEWTFAENANQSFHRFTD